MQKFHIGDDDLDVVTKIETDLSSEKVYWSSFEQFLKGKIEEKRFQLYPVQF